MNYQQWRKFKNYLFYAFLALSAILTLLPLFLVFQFVLYKGFSSLNWDFFTQMPKPVGEAGGGMKHAILGTFYLVTLGTFIALPFGLTAGILLSEYQNNFLSKVLKLTIELLSGVPSIVVGIFVYLVVVVPMKSFSALAGSIALSIIIIPVVAKSTEEILKLIPNQVREAGLALGIPRWKVITHIIVKGSFQNLITGIMLGISRASGETAPLLFTAFGNMYLSYDLKQPMASLPVQLYTYAISPFKDWQRQAWAGAFVLMIIVLGINLTSRLIAKKLK